MHNLSGQERRDTLRAALRASAEWPNVRAKLGKNSAEMTMVEWEEAFRFCYPRMTLEEWHAANVGSESSEPRIANGMPVSEAAQIARESVKPVTKPDNVDNDALALAKLLTSLKGSGAVDESAVRAIVDSAVSGFGARIDDIAAMVADLSVPTRVTVQNGSTITLENVPAHAMFPTLVKALSSRMASGLVPNIWIAGPAGSGKTTACEMAAKALGFPFYFNGALSMEHQVIGFVDAAGTYHTTPFRQAFEHGGLYLFDECDGSDNAALLPLNAALANGVCSFPDNPVPVRRHKDFVCVAAGNTWGHGATAEYIGRAKLDAAFLSRFPVKLAWDYDSALEIAISGNAEWAKRVQTARANARKAGLKVLIDPRHTQAGAGLIAAGFSPAEAAGMTYLSGLTPDQITMVEPR